MSTESWAPKWLIVQEHVSVPVDVDTDGKADLLSKPGTPPSPLRQGYRIWPSREMRKVSSHPARLILPLMEPLAG